MARFGSPSSSSATEVRGNNSKWHRLFFLLLLLASLHYSIVSSYSNCCNQNAPSSDRRHNMFDPAPAVVFSGRSLSKMPQALPEAISLLRGIGQKQQAQQESMRDCNSNITDAQQQQLPRRISFVQIGANDGEMFDTLYTITKYDKKAFIGLQVEPQPELFSSLAVLHADAAPDWTFYQGAMATPQKCRNGFVTFCETKTPGIGDWKTQGQLNGIKSRCPKNRMQQRTRPCVTSFEDLIGNHASRAFLNSTQYDFNKYHFDLLVIDTEGYDFEILKLLNFDSVKPTCIHYEHIHLGENKVPAEEFLLAAGYKVQNDGGMDTLACLVDV